MLLWLVFIGLACVVALVNPYVGFMGATFCLAYLVIGVAFDVNVSMRVRASADAAKAMQYELSTLARRNGERAAVAWKVVTVAVLVCTGVASACAWLVAAAHGVEMTPWVVHALTGLPASGAFVVLLIALLTATTIAVFARCGKLLSAEISDSCCLRK